jgi:MoaA/NifB/PqqE/SkfB family radical SAM enzyme/SAM-dependent methyltransferase
MKTPHAVAAVEPVQPWAPWAPWRCSYCGSALEPHGEGLRCPDEERWFGTDDGVHRLLPAERRRALQPFLELYQRMRRDEGWRAERGLPRVPASDPRARLWAERGERLERALSLCAHALSAEHWDVLEVGAGCAWVSARILRRGHRAAAIDLNLDHDDGLRAADRLLEPSDRLDRAEAEMDELPLAASSFDLVVASGALHYSHDLPRTLVELRRVTRRSGVLLVLDSPVYRRRQDGEAMVAARMRTLERRFRLPIPRESQSSYLVVGELRGAFASAGWTLEMHGWPGALREGCATRSRSRHGRTTRFPIHWRGARWLAGAALAFPTRREFRPRPASFPPRLAPSAACSRARTSWTGLRHRRGGVLASLACAQSTSREMIDRRAPAKARTGRTSRDRARGRRRFGRGFDGVPDFGAARRNAGPGEGMARAASGSGVLSDRPPPAARVAGRGPARVPLRHRAPVAGPDAVRAARRAGARVRLARHVRAGRARAGSRSRRMDRAPPDRVLGPGRARRRRARLAGPAQPGRPRRDRRGAPMRPWLRARPGRLRLLVLAVADRCDQRCVHCQIWQGPASPSLTLDERLRVVDDALSAGLEEALLTGGEPLLSPDLWPVADRLRAGGVRLMLATNGMLLGRHASDVARRFDEVYVSIDGPNAAVHDAQRGVAAFSRVAEGIAALRAAAPALPVIARCVLHAGSIDAFPETIQAARDLGCHHVSFLPLDAASDAFGAQAAARLALVPSADQVARFEAAVASLERAGGLTDGFVSETAGKLARFARHLRASGGTGSYERPACDAPWWSSVVDADGSLRPCFFHAPVGNARDGFSVLRAGAGYRQALAGIRSANGTCDRCVCPKRRGRFLGVGA